MTPRWSRRHESEKPMKILQLNRAALSKMVQGRQNGAARSRERRAFISTESKHTPRYVMDWLGAIMLFCMLTPSPRDSKWISSESMWLISVSWDWAKISQSFRFSWGCTSHSLWGGKVLHQCTSKRCVGLKPAQTGEPSIGTLCPWQQTSEPSVMWCYLNVKVPGANSRQDLFSINILNGRFTERKRSVDGSEI